MPRISFEGKRMAFARRHLPAPPGIAVSPPLRISDDDIHVDVVRPRDLVALSVTASGCEVVVEDGVARIRKRDNASEAFLAVDLGYQHAHEQAVFEVDARRAPEPDPAAPNTAKVPIPSGPLPFPESLSPPVGYLPARGSRLVYRVADTDSVELTTQGLLDAMARLPLSLHRRAGSITDQPADVPVPHTAGGGPVVVGPLRPGIGPVIFGSIGDTFVLADGVVARHTTEGIVVDRAGKREQAAAVDARPSSASTLSDLVARSRALSRLRSAVESRGATVRPRVSWEDVVAGPGGIGGLIGGVGGGVVIDPIRPPFPFPRGEFSSPPTPTETAIEAPFRLVITPGEGARFVHADVEAPSGHADHVELWHTRLASPSFDANGNVTRETTERRPDLRPVRAVWTRDRDSLSPLAWRDVAADKTGGQLDSTELPFRGSLNRADRHRLVRQTSERWRLGPRRLSTPTPVTARKLWFSALGSWLDLHGQWDTDPYSGATPSINSVLAWDHVAPQGRDQFVRVVYPGYLFPLGHRCVLVKITERKIKGGTDAIAGLYQRKFLVVTEPRRQYTHHDFPFVSIELAPLVTPNLKDPGPAQDSFFWPEISTGRFRFTLHARDREERPLTLSTPLLWVAAASGGLPVVTEYESSLDRAVPAGGQRIAFTPPRDSGDSVLETEVIRLRGVTQVGTSHPFLSSADVTIPAVQRLSPTGPTTISYADDYRAGGFPANAGEVWAHVRETATAGNGALATEPTSPGTQLRFGEPDAPSDRSGGFVSPSQPIKGLSTLSGPVGDLASMAGGTFEPAAYFGDALPKLFGLVSIVELVDAGANALGDAPSIVSDALTTAAQWLKDVDRAAHLAQQAQTEAQRLLDAAKAAAEDKVGDLVAAAQSTVDDATTAVTLMGDAATALKPIVTDVMSGSGDAGALTDWLDDKLDPALDAIDAAAPGLTPFLRTELTSIRAAITAVRQAADLFEQLRTLASMDPTKLAATFSYEWRPVLRSWPESSPVIAFGKKDGLLISARGRVPVQGEPEIQALAELRDFTLNLFGNDTIVRIPFDHISFKAGSKGKPEVDVVFGEIEFLGMLSFVETIKDLIPFDGFSDPPFLDVTPERLSAGFTLALPDLAIGVFTLSNLSLGADVNVPFVGKSLSVGFNFCTRERPFTLAVAFLGGGGWFGLRLNPKGLELLELGLEAGACLSVDFGVASGSVSAMIGIYMRLETDKGSLTGYFRLRGEVDVLGLVSASIELYLELVYVPSTGKMKGRAVITVQVKVLCFSGSVKIEAERQFAGANGDPSFGDVMLEGNDSPAFKAYCTAFDWGSEA